MFILYYICIYYIYYIYIYYLYLLFYLIFIYIDIFRCQVDGGSPLVCQRTDGRYVLTGLSSWSVGCKNAYTPGVYTDVSRAADWLRSEMALPESQLIVKSNMAFLEHVQLQAQYGA